MTKFIYDDEEKLIAEKIGDDFVYYLYESNEIIGFIYNNLKYFYVKDVLGRISYIVRHGLKLVKYNYTAYGEVETSGNSTLININHIIYKSYYYDFESGLYYLKSRYYNPSIGIFLQPDNPDYLQFDDINKFNLYSYCENNPVIYSDPEGNFAVTLTMIGLIVGATIGSVAGGNIAYNVAKEKGKSGKKLFAWTLFGAITGGIVGGALGAGIGALITHVTGVIGFSITKYSIIPIKASTVLGTMPGYISAAAATGSGRYLIDNELWESMSPEGRLYNNITYIKDAYKLGSQFSIYAERVPEIGKSLWEEIQYLVENNIPWSMF